LGKIQGEIMARMKSAITIEMAIIGAFKFGYSKIDDPSGLFQNLSKKVGNPWFHIKKR
jgi:hypothetical protein